MNPDLELIAKLQEDLKVANLQNDEWEKLVRQAADSLWDMGKPIHESYNDIGHQLMAIASNLHRACGVVKGQPPLPLAGARLTEENTRQSGKRIEPEKNCAVCGYSAHSGRCGEQGGSGPEDGYA